MAQRQETVAGDQTGEMLRQVNLRSVRDLVQDILDGRTPSQWRHNGQQVFTVQNRGEYILRALQKWNTTNQLHIR